MEGIKKTQVVHASRDLIKYIKPAVRQLAVCVAGFAMSSAAFWGGTAPFGVSMAACAPVKYTAAGAFGACLGYLVFAQPLDAVRYAGAAAATAVIKLALSRIYEKSTGLLFMSLSALLSLMACSAAVGAVTGLNAPELLLYGCESCLAAGGTYFIARIFVIFYGDRKLLCTDSQDTVALLLFTGIILLSLNRLNIQSFSPSLPVAVFIVLLASYSSNEQGGALAGAVCAATLGLSSENPCLILFFPLAGIISGICSHSGKLACASGAMVTALLSAVLFSDSNLFIPMLIETAVAGAVFILLPEKAEDKLLTYLLPLGRETGSGQTRDILGFRLRSASKAVNDVSDSVTAVSEALIRIDKKPISNVAEDVKSSHCSSCTGYPVCWEQKSAETMTAFTQAAEMLSRCSVIASGNLPGRLEMTCHNPSLLNRAFNSAYISYTASVTASKKINEAKMLAAGQLSCISGLLDDIADSVSDIPGTDERTCYLAKQAFTLASLPFEQVLASQNSDGRTVVQCFCSRLPPRMDLYALRDKLNEVTGMEFNEPGTDESSRHGAVLSFCEKTELDADAAVSFLVGQQQEYSGDAAEYFFDGRGSFFAVLSDGMGTGRRAAVDGLMTCSLTSRLLRTGIGVQCAMRVVNSALMVRSGEETLSTLDIARINLYTGDTVIYKSGASFSAVKNKGMTVIVSRSSLPLGILREAECEKTELKLLPGDILVLMSDGAAMLNERYFRRLFTQIKGASANDIAKKITADAAAVSSEGCRDDITAVVVKIN